jgi:hypothetical protein
MLGLDDRRAIVLPATAGNPAAAFGEALVPAGKTVWHHACALCVP